MYYIWILLYEIIFMIFEWFSVKMQAGYWITILALIGYWCILYAWLKKTGRRKKVGLIKPLSIPLRESQYGLPLLALPVFNCLMMQQITWDISYILLMMCVAVIEEVFFRGFLYDMLAKWSRFGYVFLSAFLFGAFHIVNLWEGYPLCYVVMQTGCAFAVGLCYAGITLKTESIVPAVIVHTLTNLSGSINGNFYIKYDFAEVAIEYKGLFVCSMIYLCYGIWLYKEIRNR